MTELGRSIEKSVLYLRDRYQGHPLLENLEKQLESLRKKKSQDTKGNPKQRI